MRILRAILVFSSTFSIKSLSVTTVTVTAGINFLMAKKQDALKGATKPKYLLLNIYVRKWTKYHIYVRNATRDQSELISLLIEKDFSSSKSELLL